MRETLLLCSALESKVVRVTGWHKKWKTNSPGIKKQKSEPQVDAEFSIIKPNRNLSPTLAALPEFRQQ